MNAEFSSVDLTEFTPSRSLSNSVNSGDLSSVRISLFMEMNDNHVSTSKVRQAIAWALTKHPTLFVDFEENAYAQGIEQDKTKWNRHYYGMQEVYATSNFSLERIRHMVAVREHVFTITQDDLRPATLPNTQPHKAPKQSTQHREPSSTGRTQHPEPKPENNVLKSLLLIGGVVAAIALVILAVIV